MKFAERIGFKKSDRIHPDNKQSTTKFFQNHSYRLMPLLFIISELCERIHVETIILILANQRFEFREQHHRSSSSYHRSYCLLLSASVVQGSALGPILYQLHTYDLSSIRRTLFQRLNTHCRNLPSDSTMQMKKSLFTLLEDILLVRINNVVFPHYDKCKGRLLRRRHEMS